MMMNEVRSIGLVVLGLSVTACAAEDESTLDEPSESVTLAQVQPGEYVLPRRGGGGGSQHTVHGRIAGFIPRTGRVVDGLTVLIFGGSAQRFGGFGGTERDSLRCERDQEIVGIHGRSGESLDQIGLVCAPANARHHLIYGPVHGGGGGREFNDVCNPSDKVVGFNIRSGRLIDAIQVICGPL